MELKLFKPFGWIYKPVSIPGLLITVFLIAAFVHDFIFIDTKAHSVSDTYYNFIPYGFIYIVTYLWIGSKASTRN